MSGADHEALRERILALVGEYWQARWGDERPFVPGQTRVPYGGRVFHQQELMSLVDAALEFWLTHGPNAERFEHEFARYLGVRHCLLVNSGSSANLLAVATLMSHRLGARRIAPGDEVVTLACGFPTTVAPLVQLGLVPVFVDVLPETANVDVDQLEAAVGPRSKAVMFAHTLGDPFDVAAVMHVCERHGLWLIEDNCDALGSLYDGRLTGTFGHLATSSFYPPHHMTMGEGGAVYTDDAELATVAGSLRGWGRDCRCRSGEDDSCGQRFSQQFGELPFGYDHKYVFSEFGFNLKATDLQAAIGCAQLAKLPKFTQARRENHATLSRALAPLGDLLTVQEATPGSEPSWFGLLLTLTETAKAVGLTREGVVRSLEEAGVQTRMLFGGNIVRQPCFDALRRDEAGGETHRVVGDLAVTDRMMNDAFWVGVYPGLSAEMLEYIGHMIVAAVGESG